MNTAFRIIIIDDEFDMRDSLKELLIRENYTVDLASSGEEAINQFKKNKYDLVLSDIIMQQVDGYKLLKTIKRDNPDLPVLLITGYSSIQGAIDAIKLGADDYFTKPFDVQKIKKVIKRIRDNKVVNEKKKKLNNRILSNKFPKIIGQSKAIESLLEEIEIVAKSGVSVLIIGESGTGKELVAKAIHNSSSRSLKPFVPINCAAVPKDLLESEFFGHEKGSFSGAIKRKLGLFENAHKGTLFLDELGEMDILLQPKLLRAIESQEIRRIGGVDEIKIDVRIISSTNKILLDEIDKDNFRRDLYYRLATYKIHIPPLRDRIEDIPILIHNYLKKKNLYNFKFSKEILEAFNHYDWPGNVRELENIIERVILITKGVVPKFTNLPDEIKQATKPNQEIDSVGEIVSLEELEKNHIARVFQNCNFDKAKTVEILGIGLKTLYRKLKKYDIKDY